MTFMIINPVSLTGGVSHKSSNPENPDSDN